MFSACAGIATGVGESIVATSFLSESAHIDDASIAYSEMETEIIRDGRFLNPAFFAQRGGV